MTHDWMKLNWSWCIRLLCCSRQKEVAGLSQPFTDTQSSGSWWFVRMRKPQGLWGTIFWTSTEKSDHISSLFSLFLLLVLLLLFCFFLYANVCFHWLYPVDGYTLDAFAAASVLPLFLMGKLNPRPRRFRWSPNIPCEASGSWVESASKPVYSCPRPRLVRHFKICCFQPYLGWS